MRGALPSLLLVPAPEALGPEAVVIYQVDQGRIRPMWTLG